MPRKAKDRHLLIDGRRWFYGDAKFGPKDLDAEFAKSDGPEALIYFLRYMMGMNYFIDDERKGRRAKVYELEWPDGEIRPAGFWIEGPHMKMAQLFESPAPNRLLMSSRGGFKTSGMIGRIVRNLIRFPNLRDLLFCEKALKAKQRLRLIKKSFEPGSMIADVYGDLRGDPWGSEEITLNNRTDPNLIDPSVQIGGTDKVTTGSHVDQIDIDDPVSWQQARNEEQTEKAITGWEQMEYIADPGCITTIAMTPYAVGDLAHRIKKSHSDEYEILEIPCGMWCAERGKLTGSPVFPHMSAEYLLRKLRKTSAAQFNSQYALRLDAPDEVLFEPHMFVPVEWQDSWEANQHAYIVTDTAVSEHNDACQSVVGLVVLDWLDNANIVDLRVGYWNQTKFIEQLIDVYAKWMSKLKIIGVGMEVTTLAKGTRALANDAFERIGQRINWIEIPRTAHEGSKLERIKSHHPRVASWKLRVCNTVPRFFWDANDDAQELWNPEGSQDEFGNFEPTGELVKQYCQIKASQQGAGKHQKIDIPDTFACLDETKKDGRRYFHPSPKPADADEALAAVMPAGPQIRRTNIAGKRDIRENRRRGRDGQTWGARIDRARHWSVDLSKRIPK